MPALFRCASAIAVHPTSLHSVHQPDSYQAKGDSQPTSTMNLNHSSRIGLCPVRKYALALSFLASFAWGQSVPSDTSPDAATLAKYDRNHNGVLDPNELSALEAD